MIIYALTISCGVPDSTQSIDSIVRKVYIMTFQVSHSINASGIIFENVNLGATLFRS